MGQSYDEEFASFRKNILPCTIKEAILSCGSFNEQPLAYAMLNLTDLDLMFFDCTLIAVTKDATIPKDFKGKILILETRNCPIGFARLLWNHKGKTDYFVPSRNRGHGPARKRRLMTCLNVNYTLSAASKIKPNLRLFKELTADYVSSVLCPFWPPEAAEWITRKRYYGWPTRDMLDKIVSDGFHVVSKSHQSNPNDDTTWRFSFSQAELILVTGWNEVQKYVYHILRLLKSDVIAKCGGEKKTFLCTYYFKTLMLWACEEKPSTFWCEDQVEAIVEELLLLMIEWLIEKNCPNYFIRENNMLDHLPSDTDVSNEVSLLLDAIQNISAVISFEPEIYRGKICHIRISDKVLLLGQLALNRRLFANPMNQKLERYYVKDLSNSELLVHEVELLFKALQMYRLAMTESSLSNMDLSKTKNTYQNDALKYFQSNYSRKCNSIHYDVYISLLDSFPCVVGKYLNSTTRENSQTLSYYCRTDEGNRPTMSEDPDSLCQTDERNTISEALEDICQSTLTTVDKNHQNPSYFICAAYYANFYYTCLQDYQQALNICEEALKSFLIMESILSFDTLELGFSSEILCVFINREYIHIYDAGIQAVFGFLTLCLKTVRQDEKRSPYQRSTVPDLVVQVCPVGFLDYVRIRCRKMLHKSADAFFDAMNFFDYTDNDTDFRHQTTATLRAAICVK